MAFTPRIDVHQGIWLASQAMILSIGAGADSFIDTLIKRGEVTMHGDRSTWGIGGGLLMGLGAGFFVLPESALAFVGSMIAGLGLGLIVASIIWALTRK